MIDLIGHDGSAEWSSELDEPICKVGFEISEIIDACLELGHSVTPIEAMPQKRRNGQLAGPLYGIEKAEARLLKQIYNSKGIILGMGNNAHHAVANFKGQILDPNGKRYNFEDCALHNFNEIEMYLRIDKLELN